VKAAVGKGDRAARGVVFSWQLVRHAGTDGEFANAENGHVAHGGVYSFAGPVFGFHAHV